MIANWNDLVEYYGTDINAHRSCLSKAHQSTYAMLACKWSARDPARIANQSGEHAEERLLKTAIWTDDIPSAMENRTDLDSEPMVITLALNRSPCGHCAMALTAALEKLQFNYSKRFENTVFILASLGYYQSSKYMSDDHEQEHAESGAPIWVTTAKGMEQLENAGWKLAVLSFDNNVTQRGQELADYLS